MKKLAGAGVSFSGRMAMAAISTLVIIYSMIYSLPSRLLLTNMAGQGNDFLSFYQTFYPAIRSIGRNTKFTVSFFIFMYGRGFLSRGFTDRREILHGSSATSRSLLLF